MQVTSSRPPLTSARPINFSVACRESPPRPAMCIIRVSSKSISVVTKFVMPLSRHRSPINSISPTHRLVRGGSAANDCVWNASKCGCISSHRGNGASRGPEYSYSLPDDEKARPRQRRLSPQCMMLSDVRSLNRFRRLPVLPVILFRRPPGCRPPKRNGLASFEKKMSDQPERASVRFSQKPWASALRLILKCDSNFSNDAYAATVFKAYTCPHCRSCGRSTSCSGPSVPGRG